MRDNQFNSIWTPEVIDYFMMLAQAPENFTYVEISQRLTKRFGRKIGRNACIGKGYRMGLPPRDPHPYRPVRPRVRIPPKNPGIPIDELEHWHCKFVLDPVVSQPPYQYCGMPVAEEGSSWCATHANKVFVKSRG